MTINVSPLTEARLFDFARQEGIDPGALVEKMVEAYRPAPAHSVYTPENDPLMAQLTALIAQAPTNPTDIHDAEADLLEFMRNMNAPRKETGARLLYPEAE